MYCLRITIAENQVIQFSHHEPVYLEKLAGKYKDCRGWVMEKDGVFYREFVNDAHLPLFLRNIAE